MHFAKFIRRYALTIETTEAVNQSDRITPEHVKFSVKISSKLFDRSVIVPYQCNPAYHSVELESVLQAVQSDIMLVHPDYSCCSNAGDFASELGFDDFRAAIKAWQACRAMCDIFTDFLGDQALADFFDCCEYDDDDDDDDDEGRDELSDELDALESLLNL